MEKKYTSLVDFTKDFLSPTTTAEVEQMFVRAFSGIPTEQAKVACLFCGWGAEIHPLLAMGLNEIWAVDQLGDLLSLLEESLAPEDKTKIKPLAADAIAFLLVSQGDFDLVTGLGGGPSYVGQGALLAAIKERLKSGGQVIIGDLLASAENRREEASDLFGVPMHYLLSKEMYVRLINHAGFTVLEETASTTADWEAYFNRMATYRHIDTFPFNDDNFYVQLQKERDNMLVEDPPITYVTWRLKRN